jgi:tetratricopeptide (TPR) repeat protein
VQGIISARLDTLSAEEKELLQDAAVIGKVFWADALQREADAVRAALHALERKDFVRRERRSSVEGDEEYAFRHLLVRDVAYGQIPRAARADKHRAVAEWIQALGRPEDHAEMVAHHYLAALDYTHAAGREDPELNEAARFVLRDAGERAFALNAFAAAARFFERAVALWPEDDTARPRLVLQLGHAQHFSGDERCEGTLEQARDALAAVGDNEGAAEAETILADLWWHRGQRARSDACMARAGELVADAPPSPTKARVLSQLSRYHALADETEQALAIGSEAVAMAESLGLPEIHAHALNNVAVAKSRLGDESGEADLRRSIEIALAANSPEAARGYNNLGSVMWTGGRFHESIAMFDEAVRVGEQLGNPSVVRYSRAVQIQVKFPLGEWDEGLRRADEFIAACEAGDPHYLEADLRLDRAFVRVARDDVAGALEDIRIAVERGRETADPQSLIPVLVGAVVIYDELDLVDEAKPLVEELLPHLEGLGPQFYRLADLAWVADRFGLREHLEQIARDGAPTQNWRQRLVRSILDGEYEIVANDWQKMGLLDQEAYARLRAAQRLVSEGRRAEADVQLRKALAFYRSVGATRYVREGEALLAAAS